ncbi:hypothetical protein [Kitasatospora cathayae]|uniref:Uncharacterized protein n=1 Tax=Kitasatospora cathayae TaxID=3004092 RepID=A0ABY7QAN3_9ACTN|nr:hypothetical protein [Kitasatospora sp. HUAS 3-15]WBP89591.1 hypothetical protein O1G21_29610 [Kitasatospora sp. HUAS 3-15]
MTNPSSELQDLACLLMDNDTREVRDHPLWPVYVALFRAEMGADPRPDSLSMICACPEHY